MNILYCENLNGGNLGTHASHIFGVVTSLRKLGHNVDLTGESNTQNRTELRLDKKPLWRGMRERLIRTRKLKLVRGVGVITYFILRDLWSFFRVFYILVSRKRQYDIIFRRNHFLNGEYFLGRMLHIPVIKEVNGLLVDDARIAGHAGKISLSILDIIDRYNMPKADRFIAVTPQMKSTLVEYYHTSEEKIVVIPNGTNTELFTPTDASIAREKLKLRNDKNYVCFVGAFHAWAGIENIILSAPLVLNECPDTLFLFVGDGEMKQEFLSLCVKLAITDKVIFTGMVPYHDVPLYINASDVCVCPGSENVRNERVGGGSPLKLPEYMACARPVVIGSVVELSQDIIRTRSGLAVDTNKQEELSRALISLLKDEDLRKRMGQNGRKAALEKYSWMNVATQIVEVCQGVIQSRQAS